MLTTYVLSVWCLRSQYLICLHKQIDWEPCLYVCVLLDIHFTIVLECKANTMLLFGVCCLIVV